MTRKVKSLRCPQSNGGCNSDKSWRIAIDIHSIRFILECVLCGYRISLPMRIEDMDYSFTGPLDKSGEELNS